MNGSFAGHGPGHILPVVYSAAKVIDEQGQVYAAIFLLVFYMYLYVGRIKNFSRKKIVWSTGSQVRSRF